MYENHGNLVIHVHERSDKYETVQSAMFPHIKNEWNGDEWSPLK